MKISICIPQYNRIQLLLKNLGIIAQQTYGDIEVVVSDDCSTDDTSVAVTKLKEKYKYPLVYKRNQKNLGYDRNLRQSIELASGEYCFILGNDDSLNSENDIAFLAEFLQRNDYPELGFCNYVEEANRANRYERAIGSEVLGSGYELALTQCSNFSFVAGLIYKRRTFLQYNTHRFDGSIYTQMYLSSLMIASGCILFSIYETLVIKDINAGDVIRDSYRDKIAKSWKDMRIVDGGLPSVIHVLVSAFEDAGVVTQPILYRIFLKIYSTTYPHWLLDYRSNGAFPESVGLLRGLKPSLNLHFRKLNFLNRVRIYGVYITASAVGLLTPVFIFVKFKSAVYKWLRKK